MKVSICIPTYKRSKLLLEAINSCLAQTLAPHEIIIGDDSPDENTAIVIEQLQKQSDVIIRYLHNKPGLGQMANTNRLFDNVSGDMVMLLHDDDQILPDALKSLLAVFYKDSTIDIAFGKQYIMTEIGKVSNERSEYFNKSFYRSKEYEGSVLTSLEAGLGQQFPNNAYILKRKVVEKIQFRNYGFGDNLGNGCEYDFGLRVGIEGYKMYFLDKYTAKYRVAPNSMSSSKTDDAGYQAFRILRDFQVDTKLAEKFRKIRLYERAPIAITQAVNTGRRKDAFSIFFGKWYRSRILSIGGLKRFIYLFVGSSKLK